jgi:inner membrane protein
MPSSFSHIVAGLAAGTPVLPDSVPKRYWVCAGVCAAIPDIDWLWSFRGLPYDHWLAHRGVTHSLLFAAGLGAAVSWFVLRPVARPNTLRRLWAGLALAIASHGFLDAMSTYGAGVAFLVPASMSRFFFPWRPISGGAGSHESFLSKVLIVFGRELLWIWVPSALLAVIVWWWRDTRTTARSTHDAATSTTNVL